MAMVGGGLLGVKGAPPTNAVTYSRNGAFTPLEDGRVVDTTGSTLQLLPVDADGNVTARTLAAAQDLILPKASAANPDAALVNVSVGTDGLVTAPFAAGSNPTPGKSSDERRVGKEWVSTCRSRRSPYH